MSNNDELKKDPTTGGIDNKFYIRISINGVEINSARIKLLAIREWIYEKTPRLEFQFEDAGKFYNIFPLEDHAEIKITIANSKHDVNYVDAIFRLQDYYFDVSTGNRKVYTYGMTGLLESKDFYIESKTRSFSNSNSSEVIDLIASESGFKSDIRKKSADKMTWYQINMTNQHMVDHLMGRSYVQENDCMFAYSDVQSNFVYTSLKTEITKKPKFKIKYYPDDLDASKDKNPDDKALKFKSFIMKSFSGTFNKSSSYQTSLEYYDQTDKQSITVSDDSHELTSHSLKNKTNAGKLVKNFTFGMATKNMHTNYHKGMLLNFYQRYNYFPMYAEITCEMKNQPDYFLNDAKAISLFDVVDVEFVSEVSDKNSIYSGKYIIANITHQVNQKGIYMITLMIFRNGVNMDGSGVDASQTLVS